jgi:hypothetical protein
MSRSRADLLIIDLIGVADRARSVGQHVGAVSNVTHDDDKRKTAKPDFLAKLSPPSRLRCVTHGRWKQWMVTIETQLISTASELKSIRA